MLVWLLILVTGSGFAALIYEVVWLQQLQLIIGSSAISLGLLLATYMGGLFLGSIAMPRLVSAKHHPLLIYAFIELGIGILALAIFFSLPLLGSVYLSSASQGFLNVLFRGIVSAVCLLPPTILMGTTFPIVARSIAPTKIGTSRMGLIYAANIAGAVIGCLCAGFYLLRVYDLAVATYVAVATNAVIGLVSFGLSRRVKPETESTIQTLTLPSPRGRGSIYVAIGLSGLCALGAQVIWTRLLSVLFGTTVYTFSIILAVFLLGLGIGSGVGSFVARWAERPRLALAVCQVGLMLSIGWTAWTISKSLPYWPIDPTLSLSPWYTFEVDLLRTLWTILPATLFWGASFPLALTSLAEPAQDPGYLAGEVYAANTLGAIAGALLFSFLSVPRLGTLRSQQLLIGLAGIAGLTVLTPLYVRGSTRRSREAPPEWSATVVIALLAVVALVFTTTAAEIPWQMIAYGRRIALMMHNDRESSKTNPIHVLYRGEGLDSSLVITEQAGQRIIYVNGNAEASNAPDDMRLQRMAGHVPALIHGDPREVLIVGFGAGVTAGSFVTYPEVKKIVIAELESLVPPASTEFFSRQNYGVLHDPRTRVIHDDGRHYLQTTMDTFDIITSDPVHLWVRGTSALYSKEYFELVRRHLKPGGVIAQWLPLYDGDVETMKSVLATFFTVFPDGTVWSNHTQDRGYDLVLIGQTGHKVIDVDAFQQRLERPDYSNVIASLRPVGFGSAMDVLMTYFGRGPHLQSWLEGAQINLDRNLRLQYLAGLEINSEASEQIYQSLLQYRRYPNGLFVGSERATEALKAALEKR